MLLPTSPYPDDGDAPDDGPAFVKGHGTGNDFVLLPDPDGVLDLTPDAVARLCDRRFGVGGDGILRVVRAAADDESRTMAGDAAWFMDYRNADGSAAEMCGNGIRVFARYLVAAGLTPAGPMRIATRAGVLDVDAPAAGDVTVTMGEATTIRARVMPHVEVGGQAHAAVGVLVPNPHAVVFVDDLAVAGDLATAPTIVPPAAFPDGANVEFVVRHEPGHVSMRVHERGVGETLSCGTGAVAVAWAARRRDAADAARVASATVPDHGAAPGASAGDAAGDAARVHPSGPGAAPAAAPGGASAGDAAGDAAQGHPSGPAAAPGDAAQAHGAEANAVLLARAPARYRVDVPGGTVYVVEHDDGRLDLTGPAELVAAGRLSPSLLGH